MKTLYLNNILTDLIFFFLQFWSQSENIISGVLQFHAEVYFCRRLFKAHLAWRRAAEIMWRFLLDS